MGSACTNMKYVWVRICLAGVTVGLLGHVGCTQPVDIPIENCGSVMIEGNVDGNSVRLHIYSFPPDDAGPGFRELADGSVQPA